MGDGQVFEKKPAGPERPAGSLTEIKAAARAGDRAALVWLHWDAVQRRTLRGVLAAQRQLRTAQEALDRALAAQEAGRAVPDLAEVLATRERQIVHMESLGRDEHQRLRPAGMTDEQFSALMTEAEAREALMTARAVKAAADELARQQRIARAVR